VRVRGPDARKIQRLTAKDAKSAKEMREFGTADERR
jgi:hypothetical protein